MKLNCVFLILPSYCKTIRLLKGARCGRKNPTKYLINQSFRNNIQIRLIKQWLITPILLFTAWHPSAVALCLLPTILSQSLLHKGLGLQAMELNLLYRLTMLESKSLGLACLQLHLKDILCCSKLCHVTLCHNYHK